MFDSSKVVLKKFAQKRHSKPFISLFYMFFTKNISVLFARFICMKQYEKEIFSDLWLDMYRQREKTR